MVPNTKYNLSLYMGILTKEDKKNILAHNLLHIKQLNTEILLDSKQNIEILSEINTISFNIIDNYRNIEEKPEKDINSYEEKEEIEENQEEWTFI